VEGVSWDDMLEMYGLYKQATIGDNTTCEPACLLFVVCCSSPNRCLGLAATAQAAARFAIGRGLAAAAAAGAPTAQARPRPVCCLGCRLTPPSRSPNPNPSQAGAAGPQGPQEVGRVDLEEG
jgi:hypothetical protein